MNGLLSTASREMYGTFFYHNQAAFLQLFQQRTDFVFFNKQGEGKIVNSTGFTISFTLIYLLEDFLQKRMLLLFQQPLPARMKTVPWPESNKKEKEYKARGEKLKMCLNHDFSAVR